MRADSLRARAPWAAGARALSLPRRPLRSDIAAAPVLVAAALARALPRRSLRSAVAAAIVLVGAALARALPRRSLRSAVAAAIVLVGAAFAIGTSPAEPSPTQRPTTSSGTPTADTSATPAQSLPQPSKPPAARPGASTPMDPPLQAAASTAPAPGAEGARPTEGSGGPEDRFRRAGAAYEAGRYAEAASMYESLLAEGFDDPRVHYNLGNARFKQGELGPAILEYERALVRNPSDADAKENLAYAYLLTVDKVGSEEETFPEKVMGRLRQVYGADRAAAVFAGLCLLTGALGASLWFRPRPTVRAPLRGALVGALVLTVIAGSLLAVEISRAGKWRHAIVIAATADGRSAPAADGTVLFTVHEGLKVEIRGEREGWLQVALPNGLAGWIESSRIAQI